MNGIQFIAVTMAITVLVAGALVEVIMRRDRARNTAELKAMRLSAERERAHRANVSTVWHDGGRAWRG